MIRLILPIALGLSCACVALACSAIDPNPPDPHVNQPIHGPDAAADASDAETGP